MPGIFLSCVLWWKLAVYPLMSPIFGLLHLSVTYMVMFRTAKKIGKACYVSGCEIFHNRLISTRLQILKLQYMSDLWKKSGGKQGNFFLTSTLKISFQICDHDPPMYRGSNIVQGGNFWLIPALYMCLHTKSWGFARFSPNVPPYL